MDLENVFLFVKHSIDAIKTCFVLCFFYTIYQTQKAFCASKVQITFRYRCRCIFHPISIVTFFSIVLFIDTETHDSVIFCFDPVRSSHISLRPYNKINSVLLMFIIDPAWLQKSYKFLILKSKDFLSLRAIVESSEFSLLMTFLLFIIPIY